MLKYFILCRYRSHHSFLYLIFLSIIKQDGQCTCKRNNEVHSPNSFCHAKAKLITYSECVFVVYVTQQAKRMRRIILSFVACLAVPHFSTLSHKQYDFQEKFSEYKMCVLVLSTTFV